MVNQINKAIESRRLFSIAQCFAQNAPTCAQPSSFHPHSNQLSYCKHAVRKAGLGFVNRRSPVQARASAPTFQVFGVLSLLPG
jgi:hypothetical protein